MKKKTIPKTPKNQTHKAKWNKKQRVPNSFEREVLFVKFWHGDPTLTGVLRYGDCTEVRQARWISPVMQAATNAAQRCILVRWNTKSECSSLSKCRRGNYFHVRSLQFPSASATNLGAHNGRQIVHLTVCKSTELLVLKFAFIWQPEEASFASQSIGSLLSLRSFAADYSEKCTC